MLEFNFAQSRLRENKSAEFFLQYIGPSFGEIFPGENFPLYGSVDGVDVCSSKINNRHHLVPSSKAGDEVIISNSMNSLVPRQIIEENNARPTMLPRYM